MRSRMNKRTSITRFLGKMKNQTWVDMVGYSALRIKKKSLSQSSQSMVVYSALMSETSNTDDYHYHNILKKLTYNSL